jgi:hypothetical protein
MFLAIAIVLAAMWLFGFVVFHVTAVAIHILVVLAVVAIIAHVVRGRSAGPRM